MTVKGTGDAMPVGTTSGTPQVLLGHHLKQLKLPAVLREGPRSGRFAALEHSHASGRLLLRRRGLELLRR